MSLSTLFAAQHEMTEHMMADPRVGDRFNEMFSFWMYVIGREGESVIVIEAHPPCTLPDDGKVRRFDSVHEFQSAYAYGNDPAKGYWVWEAGNGHNVAGWETEGQVTRMTT